MTHCARRIALLTMTALVLAALGGCGDDLEEAGTTFSVSGSDGGAGGDEADASGAAAGDAADVAAPNDEGGGGSDEDVSTVGEDAVGEDAAAGDAGGSDDDLGAPDAGDEDVATPPIDVPPAVVCPPGVVGCAQGERLVCNEDGTAFELDPCPEDTVCADGECVQCASDTDCDPAQTCVDGACTLTPLAVLTQALPNGLVGALYSAPLAAVGGTPPYDWALAEGATLPAGLEVEASGAITGVPLDTFAGDVEITVADAAEQVVAATLALEIVEGDLVITTPSPLPKAIEGEPYSTKFEASGGEAPYFYGALDPLPGGLVLSPDGSLSGVPTPEGQYQFAIKAFDNGLPTLSTSRVFDLEVGLAPLEIIADQIVDLWVTRMVTLPLIVVVDTIPVPYVTQLQAKGGKKPYHWEEQPLPDLVKGFIPNGGLPPGLTLAEDGTLSGAVTDPSLVINLTIPFTQIELNGFFFTARVRDSQDPPEEKSAVFIVPTVPIGE